MRKPSKYSPNEHNATLDHFSWSNLACSVANLLSENNVVGLKVELNTLLISGCIKFLISRSQWLGRMGQIQVKATFCILVINAWPPLFLQTMTLPHSISSTLFHCSLLILCSVNLFSMESLSPYQCTVFQRPSLTEPLEPDNKVKQLRQAALMNAVSTTMMPSLTVFPYNWPAEAKTPCPHIRDCIGPYTYNQSITSQQLSWTSQLLSIARPPLRSWSSMSTPYSLPNPSFHFHSSTISFTSTHLTEVEVIMGMTTYPWVLQSTSLTMNLLPTPWVSLNCTFQESLGCLIEASWDIQSSALPSTKFFLCLCQRGYITIPDHLIPASPHTSKYEPPTLG